MYETLAPLLIFFSWSHHGLAGVKTHPERRFKAAFEAYKDAELPQLRKDRPGLRLQQ